MKLSKDFSNKKINYKMYLTIENIIKFEQLVGSLNLDINKEKNKLFGILVDSFIKNSGIEEKENDSNSNGTK